VLVATAAPRQLGTQRFAHALMTGPMNVVVRPLDNPLIDALVERRRALTGNRPSARRTSRAHFEALPPIRRSVS